MAISVVRTPKSEDPYSVSVHRIRHIDVRPYRYRPRALARLWVSQLSSLPRAATGARGGTPTSQSVRCVGVSQRASCDTRNRDWRLPRLDTAYGYSKGTSLDHLRSLSATLSTLALGVGGPGQQSAVGSAPGSTSPYQCAVALEVWKWKCAQRSPPPLPSCAPPRAPPSQDDLELGLTRGSRARPRGSGGRTGSAARAGAPAQAPPPAAARGCAWRAGRRRGRCNR